MKMATEEQVIKCEENFLKKSVEEEDDDVPQLSADTLKALQEFYAETEENCAKIDEDWQLSQFWYDTKTSETLAKEVLTLAMETPNKQFNVACVSCPTLFKTLHFYLKESQSHSELKQLDSASSSQIDIKLFEYDDRFNIYGNDFVFYDYKQPLEMSDSFSKYFDLIIADPPFLSNECHIKTGMTIRKLGKEDHKLIICTGAIMEELLASSLKVKLCSFVPRHERNLANEFKCYSNYDTLFLNE